MRNLNLIATVVLFGLAAAVNAVPARAAEITVNMLNKGVKGGMVFEPDLVKAMPGDTIKFVSVDKGHNVETIKGMLPEGATEFKSKMGDNHVMEAQIEGIYGVKCTPHYGMGMVALIVVGNPQNIDAVKAVKQSGKAKERFAAAFAEYEAAK